MLLIALMLGCNSKMDEATVKGVVEKAFLEANPTTGHFGLELVGKGQWFDNSFFEAECLMGKELAFTNYKKSGQLSPSYPAQQAITATTPRGYCLDLGENLSYKIESIEHVSEMGSMDIQNVTFRFDLKNPTPWASCLKENSLQRTVRVENLDGTPKLNAKDTVAFQSDNRCVNPILGTPKKSASPRPEGTAPKEPTMEEIKTLAQKFDDAIFNQEYENALGMLSCVNLLDGAKWGMCAVSDLVGLGPSTHGDERMEGPWLEGTQYNFEAIEKIVADKADKSIFHVLMPHRKTKATRSFSVQWVNNGWKLLGAVSIPGAGLTSVRLMNDLHEKQYRDAFDKRLAGEEVDFKGNLLNPDEDEE